MLSKRTLFESANVFAVETIIFGGMIESLVFGPLGKVASRR